MRLLIFFNTDDDIVHRLQRELLPFSNLIDVNYFNNFDKFSLALRGSLLSETLIIYCASDDKSLKLAQSIRKLLTKAKLLFILQHNRPDLVAQVNELHPRYYTFASGNLKDVKAVVARMINSLAHPGLTLNTVRTGHQTWSDGKPDTENSLTDR